MISIILGVIGLILTIIPLIVTYAREYSEHRKQKKIEKERRKPYR